MKPRFQFSSTFLGILALTVTSIMGGTTYSLTKYSMRFFNPSEFLTYRLLLGVLILVLFRPKVLRSFSAANIRKAFPTGCLLGSGMLSLWQAVKYSDTGLSAFVANAEFVLIPIIAYLCFKELISRSTALLILLGLIGMGLLTLKDGFQVSYGEVFLFLSVSLFAFYAVFNTRLSRQMDPFELSVLNLSISAVVSAVASGIEGCNFGFEAETIWYLIYLGPVMTGIRFYFITYGQSKIDAPHAGLIYLCEPITASLIGYLILDEMFSGLQLFGMVLLIGTVVGSFVVIESEEGELEKQLTPTHPKES